MLNVKDGGNYYSFSCESACMTEYTKKMSIGSLRGLAYFFLEK